MVRRATREASKEGASGEFRPRFTSETFADDSGLHRPQGGKEVGVWAIVS